MIELLQILWQKTYKLIKQYNKWILNYLLGSDISIYKTYVIKKKVQVTDSFLIIKKKKKKLTGPILIWGLFYVRALGYGLNGLGPALCFCVIRAHLNSCKSLSFVCNILFSSLRCMLDKENSESLKERLLSIELFDQLLQTDSTSK